MTRDEILSDIADRRLGVKPLENRIKLYQLPVCWIKKALEEAFESGRQYQLDIINGDGQALDL